MKTRLAGMGVSVAALMLLAGARGALATETVIHSFGDVAGDGFNPQSDLIADAAGNLYGTTLYGGTNGSCCGTVFMLTPAGGNAWNETILYAFQGGADAASPNGGLAFDRNGNLYGTTEAGGANNQGTVFELSAGTWKESVLYSFCSQTGCTDGQLPLAGVTIGKKGVLYGTTTSGGTGLSGNAGTVFRLTPPKVQNGNWRETVLHNFCDEANCADGYIPLAGRLLLTGSGVLWGTASRSDGGGTLFSLTPNGSGFDFAVGHDFSLSNGDGRGPYAGVVADRNGVLYGTTVGDSANGCGTVYSFGGGYQQLYVFCSKTDHSDGALPYAGVVVNGSGTTLYGTTFSGGANNGGVVYKLTGGSERVLHAFCPKSGCLDGANPGYGSLLNLNGTYYGTTMNGGNSNEGVAYSITKR